MCNLQHIYTHYMCIIHIHTSIIYNTLLNNNKTIYIFICNEQQNIIYYKIIQECMQTAVWLCKWMYKWYSNGEGGSGQLFKRVIAQGTKLLLCQVGLVRIDLHSLLEESWKRLEIY